MDIKIYVVAHKPYKYVKNRIYTTLKVGNLKENVKFPGVTDDEQPDNISELNPYYNEMTGLYWIWKHSTHDVVGLCHYRRYFFCPFHKAFFRTPITKYYCEKYLKNHEMIVQRKSHHEGVTVREYYCDGLIEDGLIYAEEAIKKMCPEYLEAFDKIMNDDGMYSCNMFIARKNLVDEYCEWVFPILEYIHSSMDYTELSERDKRACGMTAERLMNVWILKNNISVYEVEFQEKRNVSRVKWVLDHYSSKPGKV